MQSGAKLIFSVLCNGHVSRGTREITSTHDTIGPLRGNPRGNRLKCHQTITFNYILQKELKIPYSKDVSMSSCLKSMCCLQMYDVRHGYRKWCPFIMSSVETLETDFHLTHLASGLIWSSYVIQVKSWRPYIRYTAYSQCNIKLCPLCG